MAIAADEAAITVTDDDGKMYTRSNRKKELISYADIWSVKSSFYKRKEKSKT